VPLIDGPLMVRGDGPQTSDNPPIIDSWVAAPCCSSWNTSWVPSFELLSSKPATATLTIESDPPGADASISTGASCRTPCSLAAGHVICDSPRCPKGSGGNSASAPAPIVDARRLAPPPPKPRKADGA
jgi:hypothetical protein